MVPKLSFVVAAGVAALSLNAAAYASDSVFPVSVNETGPVNAQHQAVPAAPVGRTADQGHVREVGSAPYEVRTPSSVSESAPWLTGTTTR